jgi:hypothetical protein
MWVLWLLGLLVLAPSASAESGLSEKYERDYESGQPVRAG